MTDPHTLTAGRETDVAVAELLGWTEIEWFREMDNRDNWGGIKPGGNKRFRIPSYSTIDAALEALEEFKTRTGLTVRFETYPASDEPEQWSVFAGQHDDVAQTLYLAICRLVVAVLGKEPEAAR